MYYGKFIEAFIQQKISENQKIKNFAFGITKNVSCK